MKHDLSEYVELRHLTWSCMICSIQKSHKNNV